jgi:undecaprenyl-diphosphatase
VEAAEGAALLGDRRHEGNLNGAPCCRNGRGGSPAVVPLWSTPVLTWWQAVVLGLVEGVTEYLPVSSTGHLILTASLLGLDRPDTKAGLDAYLIVLQGGAILAVLALYWPRVLQMANGLLGRNVEGRRLAGHVALAFVPAAVVGALAGSWIHARLFGIGPVLVALAVGGLWMIWLDRRARRGTGELATMTWPTALGIGLCQIVAMWPGTSRSMMTIGGGMLLGLNPVAAAEFSFLLGLPTLGAACAHDLVSNVRDAMRTGTPSMFQQLGIGATLLGIVVATVSAAIAVRWLVGFLNRHGLAPFGWYRLALAAILALFLL